MEQTIDLTFWQLAAAYLFVLILVMIVKVKGIPREREILIATVRMTIQLVLVGYILAYVFDHSHPLYTIVIIAVMEGFAVFNIFKRVKSPISLRLKQIIALSMVAGSLASILYFILVVIHITPWYEPRYFIPIAGMLVGNAMTAVSLGVSRLLEGMHAQKHLVETALMLGATPKMASRDIINTVYDAAIMPTINSMVGMGIVFLPGMMTGQILSGASPLLAIEYQIAIMLGLVGSVSLTVILLVQLGYKTFFNNYSQIIEGEV